MSRSEIAVAGSVRAKPGGIARDRIAILGAALATFALACSVLRHGLSLGPDAWTYWSSSVSLLEGRGYVDAHGLAVVEWPPLYPSWLAVAQWVGGVSIGTVRVAEAIVLGGLAGLATAWVLRRTGAARSAGAGAGGNGTAPRWPVAIWFAATLLVAERTIDAGQLTLVFLFLLLGSLDALRGARSRTACAVAIAGVAVSTAAACATRYAALAFVPAALVVLATMRPLPRRTRVLAAAALVAAVAATLVTLRGRVGHGWGSTLLASSWTLGPTAVAMGKGVGRSLTALSLGFFVFVAASVLLARRDAGARRRDATAQRDAVVFTWVSLLALGAMFLFVAVTDPPNERFVRFASLIVGGLAVGAACGIRRPHLRWLVLALLLLPNVVRATNHVARGRMGRNTVTPVGGEAFLPADATLRQGTPAGTVLPDGLRVVEVPLFVWQRERIARGEAR